MPGIRTVSKEKGPLLARQRPSDSGGAAPHPGGPKHLGRVQFQCFNHRAPLGHLLVCTPAVDLKGWSILELAFPQ